MRTLFLLVAIAVLPFGVTDLARAVDVQTPKFAVELPGDNWRQLPLAQGATPWRYARDVGDGHKLFVAVTWIPQEAEDDGGVPPDAAVAEEIMTEARRQTRLPGRKLLEWSRAEEAVLADGKGCWRYASDFRVAVNVDEKVDYRSRGFICHVPEGAGLAWLRYDEFKAPDDEWIPGFEKAAVEFRESLRPAERQ